jgi:hypothetical protein
MSAPRLTKPLRDAIAQALEAALAGGGFDGGDFNGLNRADFERASYWIAFKSRNDASSKGEAE